MRAVSLPEPQGEPFYVAYRLGRVREARFPNKRSITENPESERESTVGHDVVEKTLLVRVHMPFSVAIQDNAVTMRPILPKAPVTLPDVICHVQLAISENQSTCSPDRAC